MSELQVDLTHAGVPSAELQGHAASLGKALAALDETPAGDFLRIVHSPAVLREIRACAKRRPPGVTDVVQLGIGGSSLGAQALCTALLPSRHNQFVRRPGLRFHFPDNIDPDSFAALLRGLHPKRTLVHVVSKSGGTLETQAQLHALLEWFTHEGRRFPLRRNLVVTTGPDGSLREFAEEQGIPILTFPEVPEVRTVLLDRKGSPFLGAGEATQGPTPAAIAAPRPNTRRVTRNTSTAVTAPKNACVCRTAVRRVSSARCGPSSSS